MALLVNLKVSRSFEAYLWGILEEKRDHNQKIASLKNQLKDEQKYSDEQDAALGKFTEFAENRPKVRIQKPFSAEINRDMEPFKKQNKMLMNIIGAAEKGHNMLLSTMQSINSEISGNL